MITRITERWVSASSDRSRVAPQGTMAKARAAAGAEPRAKPRAAAKAVTPTTHLTPTTQTPTPRTQTPIPRTHLMTSVAHPSAQPPALRRTRSRMQHSRSTSPRSCLTIAASLTPSPPRRLARRASSPSMKLRSALKSSGTRTWRQRLPTPTRHRLVFRSTRSPLQAPVRMSPPLLARSS